MVTTGPGYMTKRQEALDAMSQILQGNPQLWTVAGDLFIKNMDWPGAQEMAARFKKILDPKVLADGDQSPEMAAAQQQIEAMTQELNRVTQIMESIQDSAEQQKVATDRYRAEIDAYNAETKRIAAMQAGMTPEQVQEIVMHTLASAMDTGDIIGDVEGLREMPEEPEMGGMPPPQMGGMPPQMGGMPPEMPEMAPEQPPEGMM
jgi:hypothetical protein